MRKLCIDPGHGGSDPGGSGFGKLEKFVVLDIALAMQRQALSRGLQAVLTRTGDKDVPLTTRYEIANRWGADLFMSVHTNASGGRGLETLYGKPQYRQLAVDLVSALHRATGWPIRRPATQGTWYRPGVAVLRGTNMPAVLSECGFIDCPEENTAMSDPAWIERVAKAHIDVACQYLGITEEVGEVAIYPLIEMPMQGDRYVWVAPDCFTQNALFGQVICYLNAYNETGPDTEVEIITSPNGKSVKVALGKWQRLSFDMNGLAPGNPGFATIVKSKVRIAPTMTVIGR